MVISRRIVQKFLLINVGKIFYSNMLVWLFNADKYNIYKYPNYDPPIGKSAS